MNLHPISMTIMVLLASVTITRAKPVKHLLVVTLTKGYHHESIAVAEQVIEKLGNDSRLWKTDFVRTDAEMKAKMSPSALDHYDGVIFCNTTGLLPLPDPEGFLDYIREGHGFAGVHAGADTFHTWPGETTGVSRYARMLGGEFNMHNQQCAVSLTIADPEFPACAPLNGATSSISNSSEAQPGHSYISGSQWHIYDEIYLMKNFDPAKVHLLIYDTVHPADGSAEAGTPGIFPISWSKKYGKGRVFYTALGHRDDVWEDPLFQQHLLGGIEWILHLKRGSYASGNVK